MNIHITNNLSEKKFKSRIAFQWLGQAGFLFYIKNQKIIIDPYLSDSLAKKYAGQKFDHRRISPPPINPKNLEDINWLLCTHRHTDHMDPETLLPISQSSASCKFIVPTAWTERVVEFGITRNRIVSMNAFETKLLSEDIILKALPSAHENLDTDKNGNYLNIGYILKINDTSVYHSGDCIPYNELITYLENEKPAIAFLPVNGRDDYRAENGIPGNFTIDEAIQLCLETRIPILVCHHFGMFTFNTIGLSELEKKKQFFTGKLEIIIPETTSYYHIN
jgi:L-ascorbate metabolism protein UlaG (beta-lactamase superfamily)